MASRCSAQLLVFFCGLQKFGWARPAPARRLNGNMGAVTVASTAEDKPFEWKYADDHNSACSGTASPCGPSDWGNLAGYESCSGSAGTQSPISLNNSKAIDGHPTLTADDLTMECEEQTGCDQVDYILNAHTIEVDLTKTCLKRCSATWAGKKYYLERMNYHSPSEHMMTGGYFPMEAHHIHKSDDGKVLIIAVLLTIGNKPVGSPNFTYSQGTYLREIFRRVPNADATNNYYTARDSKPSMGLNPYMAFIPTMNCGFFYYTGSTTAPPCTPDTTWLIAPEPVRIVQETLTIFREKINSVPAAHSQLATFNAITGNAIMPHWNSFVHHNTSLFSWNTALKCNNRPIQPMGSRAIYDIKAKDPSRCWDPQVSPCHAVLATTTSTTTSAPLVSCVNYPCPSGSTLRPNASEKFCHLPTGCNSLDQPLCCDGTSTTAPCAPVPTTTGCGSFICPTGMKLKTPTVSPCTGSCDYDQCCDDSSTDYQGNICTKYTCPTGWILKPSPSNIYCKSSQCNAQDVSTCCKDLVDSCAHFTCPSGLVLRPNAGLLLCAGSSCHHTDTATCCQVSTTGPNPCAPSVIADTYSSTSNWWGRPDVIAGTAIGGAAAAAGIAGAIAGGIAASKKDHDKDKKPATLVPTGAPPIYATTSYDLRARVSGEDTAEDTSSLSSSSNSLPGSWGMFCILAILAALLCCIGAAVTAFLYSKKKKKSTRSSAVERKNQSRQLLQNPEGRLVSAADATDPAATERDLTIPEISEFGSASAAAPSMLSSETWMGSLSNMRFGPFGFSAPRYAAQYAAPQYATPQYAPQYATPQYQEYVEEVFPVGLAPTTTVLPTTTVVENDPAYYSVGFPNISPAPIFPPPSLQPDYQVGVSYNQVQPMQMSPLSTTYSGQYMQGARYQPQY